MVKVTVTRAATARSVLGAAVLAVCIAAGMGQSSNKVLALASLAIPVSARVMDACVVCFEWYCESGWHDAFDWEEYGEEWHRNGGAHYSGPCWEYTCDVRHGPTGCVSNESTPLTDGDLEKLRTGVVAGDTAAVSSILSAHPQRLALNLSRSAIQLVSCDGSVGMHMPVPAWMARTLAEATPASTAR